MATLEQRLDYIQNAVMYLVFETYNYIRSWCPKKVEKCYTEEDYLQACVDGDTKLMESLLKKHEDFDRNEGLVRACAHGHAELAELLVNNGADDLDRGLKVACKNNRYSTAELMVKKGANTIVGHRHATSTNITRMLFRYEQGSEIIN